MDNYVEIWKMKKLVQRLMDAHGAGTSMISLVLPPGSQIALTNRMLTIGKSTSTTET